MNDVHRQVGDLTAFTPGNETAVAQKDAEIAQLRGTLSLAEEGLANYEEENQRLRAVLQDLADCCGHDDDKALLLALRNAAKALAPCSRTPQSAGHPESSTDQKVTP